MAAGVPRPDLVLFNGSEGGSGDDSFLSFAKDMEENFAGDNQVKRVSKESIVTVWSNVGAPAPDAESKRSLQLDNQMKLQDMFKIQKKSDLMKELFADSSLYVAPQNAVEVEEVETEPPFKGEKRVISEKLAKRSKKDNRIMTSLSSPRQEVSRAHSTKEDSFSRPKSGEEYLKCKNRTGSKFSVTPPAVKISPMKKFSYYGKLSTNTKVEEDFVVKPQFQFNQLKAIEEGLDTDLKDLYNRKLESISVFKKSKANGSLEKESVRCTALDNDFNSNVDDSRTFFTFLDNDKISAPNFKSKEASSKMKNGEENVEPMAKRKETISSVFEVEDDPYVLKIQARKKKEAEKLVKRQTLATKRRTRESIKRMTKYSQSLTCSQSSDECLLESCSGETQKMIDSISIDDLLKLPDRPEGGGKTKEEELDDIDIEIAKRKQKHEEEMAMIDTEISAEKQRQQERRERMKKNAGLRDRIEREITKSVLIRMFEENVEYLKNIEAGRVESMRHESFHKSCRTRQALFYTMITDPFTDPQLEWTLEEMEKVWMKTKKEQMQNNEYMWKVLLPECFIKFYMDHFGLEKEEAEKKISETPLRKTLEDSQEETSSEDEI